MLLLLFNLKGDPAKTRAPGSDDRTKRDDGGSRIRCPQCAWEPQRDDRWLCSCLHSWNTFETRGVCPACTRAWLETQCLRCQAWSPHEVWYVDERKDG